MNQPQSLISAAWAVAGAIAAGAGRFGLVWYTNYKSKKATRLDDDSLIAKTAEAMTKSFGTLVDSLQGELSLRSDAIQALQRENTALREGLAALEKRMDDSIAAAQASAQSAAMAATDARHRAEAAEARSDYKTRQLQKYISVLTKIMREAGLVIPDPPTLEPNP